MTDDDEGVVVLWLCCCCELENGREDKERGHDNDGEGTKCGEYVRRESGSMRHLNGFIMTY